jgi:hypothetical protein
LGNFEQGLIPPQVRDRLIFDFKILQYMFQEIDPLLIMPPENHKQKRWFRDTEAECDLFVWEDLEGKVMRFQFWHQDALVEWNEDSGLKTGHLDQESGAFVHYQTETYRLHREIDSEIVILVKNLLNNNSTGDQKSLNYIKDILHEISDRD